MKIHLYLFSLLFFFSGISSHLSAGERPNIILIMADDMGWSDIGCYGGEIETPNIDRIAGEGMKFMRFYNNGKCTTTRASLMTGLYPRNGGKGIELLNENMLTLGEAMRLAGYQTGISGKWHNGSKAPHRPIDRGFDLSYGLWDGCSNFFDPNQPDPKFKGGKVRFFGEGDQRITEFPDDFYTTDAFTDHAIDSIKNAVDAKKPFFHYIPYTAPHYPLHARPEDIKKYAGKYDLGWDAVRKARYQRQVEMGLIDPAIYPDPGPNPDNKSWAKGRNENLDWETARMEVYAAMVDRMDQQIGRVLALLDELKIADNTVIIFHSDNGGCPEKPGGNDIAHFPGPKEYYSHVGENWAYAQNTPFRRYKSDTHEGGIATPMVVRWPAKIKAGQTTDQVGHIIDFMPTFLELAETDYPVTRKGKPLYLPEGVSLASVLTGKIESRERPAPLFWFWSKNRAVQEGRWKLVWENGSKVGWELYNLKKDRTETNNLAKENPSTVNQMARKWIAWAELTGVKY